MAKPKHEAVSKFILVLTLTLQISGFARAFYDHPSHKTAAQSSAPTVSAAHNHSEGESDQEPSPGGHHHCKSHPAGSCCAYISLTEVRFVREFRDQVYGLKSDFFFFELISSHLRPPAVRV